MGCSLTTDLSVMPIGVTEGDNGSLAFRQFDPNGVRDHVLFETDKDWFSGCKNLREFKSALRQAWNEAESEFDFQVYVEDFLLKYGEEGMPGCDFMYPSSDKNYRMTRNEEIREYAKAYQTFVPDEEFDIAWEEA